MVGLGVQGVGRGDLPCQVERGEQGREGGDLASLGLDLALGDDGLVVVGDGGERMHCAVCGAAAAQGLARRPRWRSAGRCRAARRSGGRGSRPPRRPERPRPGGPAAGPVCWPPVDPRPAAVPPRPGVRGRSPR